MLVLRGADLDVALGDLAVVTDHRDHVAVLAARHGLLGQGDGVRRLGLLDLHAHIETRQQHALGIGHFGAQRDLAGGAVDRQVGEQQLAVAFIDAAVFQNHLDAGGVGTRSLLQLAFGHGLAQLEGFARRLGEVDIDRIDLLDHGQRRGFALADQRAFGDQRLADAARDGRRDLGIAQADIGGAHTGRARGDIGQRLFISGLGIDEILLADGIGFDQGLVAFELGLGLRQIGLRARQCGTRALRRGFIGSGIDAVQGLAGLDVAAFAVQAFEQDAGAAGAHLGHARSFDAAWQFGHQTDIARRGNHYTNFHLGRLASGRRRGLALCRLVATGCQRERRGNGQRQGCVAV